MTSGITLYNALETQDITWARVSDHPNVLRMANGSITWNATPYKHIYDYAAIREYNAIEIACVAEYFNNPRFIMEYLQSVGEDDMNNEEMYQEWFDTR